MQTLLKLTTARDFLDEIVKKDFADFSNDPASLRKAFHCAVSLYHLHEWVFADYKTQLSFKSPRDFDKSLWGSPDFVLIRDIANAVKHMELTRDPQRITHAANTEVQSTGYGKGGYGRGPYSGTARVRVHVAPMTYEEFEAVARKVLQMWENMFLTNNW